MMKSFLRCAAIASALFAGSVVHAAPVAGPAEDRWLGFVGCWRANDAPLSSALCIIPDGQGVRMIELSDGAVTRESRIVADGQPAPISQEGCTGTERARWSADGERVFLNTEMVCGAQTARRTSGVFARVSSTQWVSVQALEVDAEAATRVVRYTAVDAPANVPEAVSQVLKQNRLAHETARFAWMSVLDVADVSEAVIAVHARAVEALVIARDQPVNLDGRQLVALKKSGVPSFVTDAMVAVSHPDRFAIATPEQQEPTNAVAFADPRRVRIGGGGGYAGYGCNDSYGYASRFDSGCDPRYTNMRYSPYDYYSPYGYDAYGWRYRNQPIILVPNPNATEDEHGTVTRRGYTRRRSTDDGSSSGRSSGASARSSDSSSSGSSTSGSSSSDESTRRTAKPRGS